MFYIVTFEVVLVVFYSVKSEVVTTAVLGVGTITVVVVVALGVVFVAA